LRPLEPTALPDEGLLNVHPGRDSHVPAVNLVPDGHVVGGPSVTVFSHPVELVVLGVLPVGHSLGTSTIFSH
jgi:hypothetical protein